MDKDTGELEFLIKELWNYKHFARGSKLEQDRLYHIYDRIKQYDDERAIKTIKEFDEYMDYYNWRQA